MIQYIWFDLGYTLLYLNREQAYQSALKEHNISLSIEDITRGFHFTDKLFMREYHGYFGGPPEYYMPLYVGRMNMFLKVKVDIIQIYNRWMELRGMQSRQWEAYGFCGETLKGLKEQGFILGVISNWDASARPILDDLELTQYFDHIVISSEVGVEKPDPRIFQNAFEESGADAKSSLYVGDNYYDDALGSRAVGMECLIINRYGDFGIEELDDCKVIPDIRSLLTHAEAVK